MAKLVYTAIMSLDGYVADSAGAFDWSAPDAEVHAFINDLERPIGTYLLGRRMYQVMVYWETVPTSGDGYAIEHDYAQIWQAADKVVYSTTLQDVSSARTRLKRSFDVDEVRRLKATADRDLGVGGSHLAEQALKAGLVDECHFFLVSHLVGGGTRALPDGLTLELTLLGESRFGNGTVHLHYAVGTRL